MSNSFEERRTEQRLNKLIKSIGRAIRSGDEERSHQLGLEYGSIIAARFEADVLEAQDVKRRDRVGAEG